MMKMTKIKKAGTFELGNTPHNKGKNLSDYLSNEKIEKIKETQFVEGVHTGDKSLSWKGGTQRMTNDCTLIWTGTNERKRRPVMIYEKAHGKMKPGWIIYHLDKDKDNDEIENLISIPRAVLIALNTERLEDSLEAITEAVKEYLDKNPNPKPPKMASSEDFQAAHDSLKKSYDNAVADKKLIFDHEGQQYLVAYAKYRLEYFQLMADKKAKKNKK